MMGPESRAMQAGYSNVPEDRVMPCESMEDFDQLEREMGGYAAVRAYLEHPDTFWVAAVHREFASKWLIARERTVRERQEQQRDDLLERSTKAAEDAAKAAKASAWTAAIAIGVSLIAICISVLQLSKQ